MSKELWPVLVLFVLVAALGVIATYILSPNYVCEAGNFLTMRCAKDQIAEANKGRRIVSELESLNDGPNGTKIAAYVYKVVPAPGEYAKDEAFRTTASFRDESVAQGGYQWKVINETGTSAPPKLLQPDAPPITQQSHYELFQSPLAAKFTFLLDRYSGQVSQLVEIGSDKTWEWQSMKVIGNSPVTSGGFPRYRLFASPIGARYTFLIDESTGQTWLLVQSGQDGVLSWEPMNAPGLPPGWKSESNDPLGLGPPDKKGRQ